jgi:hypothetical protein
MSQKYDPPAAPSSDPNEIVGKDEDGFSITADGWHLDIPGMSDEDQIALLDSPVFPSDEE